MPAPKTLADILARHQGGAPVDRSKDRETYLERLTDLYQMIEGWLKPSTDEKLANVIHTGVSVEGDPVEPYAAPALSIDVGSRRIRFVPVGFSLIGADGRVDLDGGDRTTMLIHRDSAWYFARRQPKLETILLTEESFTEAIEELLGE